MYENIKIVRFDLYCEKCAHHDKEESDSPCDECLEVGARQYSSKPERFVEK